MTGAYGGAQQYEISVRGHLGETMRSAFPPCGLSGAGRKPC